MENLNSRDYLEKIRTQVIENLSRTKFAPSVQMQEVPRDPEGFNDEDGMADDMDEDGEGADRRYTQRRWDQRVERDGELSESEDEAGDAANGVRRQNGARRRRNERNFKETVAPLSGSGSAVGTPAAGGPTTAPEGADSISGKPGDDAGDDLEDIEMDEEDLPTSALRDGAGPEDAEATNVADEEDVDMTEVDTQTSKTEEEPVVQKPKIESADEKAQEMELDHKEVEKKDESASKINQEQEAASAAVKTESGVTTASEKSTGKADEKTEKS